MPKERSLSDILKDSETTVAGTLYSYLSDNKGESKLDKTILGLQEVKENILKALFKAKFAASMGYVPILVLTGPSGSGKTEMINAMIDSYFDAVAKNGGVYSLSANGVLCQYKENPYNLLRSKLPFKIGDLDVKIDSYDGIKKRPTMCDSCREALNTHTNDAKKRDEVLGVKKFFPDVSSNIEIGDRRLQDRLYPILSKANRGILILSADKSNLEKIQDVSYQLLINMYDNMLSDKNGGNIPLDMLVIIHGNEEFMERLNNDERDVSRPLRERMIPVEVRRILSQTEEEKLYKKVGLPFENMPRNALKYLSTFGILSRVDDLILRNDVQSLRHMVDILDIYDSGRLDQVDVFKIPKSLDDYISNLGYSGDDNTEIKLIDKVLSLIKEDNKYISGWSKGMSFRRITSLLKTSEKSDMKYTDIFSFINGNADVFGETESFYSARDYVLRMAESDINTDVDNAILSFLSEKEGLEMGPTVSVLEKKLGFRFIDEKDRKFTPEEESTYKKIEKYINIDDLDNYTEEYRDNTAIRSSKFVLKLDPLMRYTYADRNYDNFIKMDNSIIKALEDKESKLYTYISDFLKKNYGYWDGLTEEAVNIYREGPGYYSEMGEMF